ncbi:unnamed protein product [Lymnaea stagnalis]|uniref:Threonine synthase N-terminal domain-containing protein n=1 Tax=Lymnaea stagnalis TaxID=6523 RepID=A0AAV2H038_LYMST
MQGLSLVTRQSRWINHIPQCRYWFYITTCHLHQKQGHTWKSWKTLSGKGNIILMGSPGSGKTTTAKIVGRALGKRSFDIDDDLLTPVWGMSVAKKLKEIGEMRFLEEEGQVLLGLDVQNSVVSLSGSNPLVYEAMAKIGEQGIFVYLDATNETILKRQKVMKVDRIVGMGSGASLEDVINFRRNSYEDWYDIRVLVHPDDTQEHVAQRVLEAVKKFENNPGHVSTRGTLSSGKFTNFLDTVLQGIAPDGGLYVQSPSRPKLSLEDINRLVPLTYRERALRLLELWIHPLDISPQELRSFIEKSYKDELFEPPDLAPVVHLSGNQFVLELFHGPTGSFKDWPLQLMPRFFTKAMKLLENPDAKYLILVATSGDTGSATLDGFSRHAGECFYAGDAKVGVIVLYPTHNISKIQKWQTTAMEGSNIKVIGVDSDFDFCQQTVKKIFRDSNVVKSLGNCNLSAANSINWGRLLPQTLYHASAYMNLVRDGHIKLGDQVDYCVPTGNFGNILSAFYVKEMGFPIRKLICASNANNILTDFLHSGTYKPSAFTLQRTISPSIDIIESSNLERLLFHLSGEDPHFIKDFYIDAVSKGQATVSQKVKLALQENFVAGYATETNTKETLLKVFRTTGYLLDPHTSVAHFVATNYGDVNFPTLISGTAHHGKFIDNILPLLDPKENFSSLRVDELIQRATEVTSRPKMNRFLQSMLTKKIQHKDTVAEDYGEICTKVVDFANTL